MKIIVVVFALLCFVGSGIDPKYDVVSSEFIDEGLPEIVQEVWRSQGVVRKQLFFLQMYAQQLFGLMPQNLTVSIALVLLASLFVAGLSITGSQQGQWWYKDAEGVVRGPFSTFAMFHWRSIGYIPDDLEIKCAANGTFAPLRDLFPEPAVPFKSPPTPPGARDKTFSSKHQMETFEEEVSADMLRDQHQAFESRVQGLEEEMIMTLEADLEDSVLSDDVGQKAVSNLKDEERESWSSYFKPYDEEELEQIREWRAERQLHRKEFAQSQIQMSRYNPDRTRKRNSSEERIQKQFNTWCCNEIVSEHEAQLEVSLSSLIEL